jgi:hypothetical protein
VSELYIVLFCFYQRILHRFTTYRAGLTKYSLPIDDDGSAVFSYCEKGMKIDGKPSIVFVHGLSSNKETWISIVKVSKGKLFISFKTEI